MLTFPSASLRPQTVLCGIGILADCPSRMRLRLRLGPDLPRVDERCPGNLRLSVLQFLTAVFATHTGILTSSPSSRPFGRPSSKLERSPTKHCCFRRFGSVLQPRLFSAQSLSTGELLRTLLMMAASEPTSRLFLRNYLLNHLAQHLGP